MVTYWLTGKKQSEIYSDRKFKVEYVSQLNLHKLSLPTCPRVLHFSDFSAKAFFILLTSLAVAQCTTNENILTIILFPFMQQIHAPTDDFMVHIAQYFWSLYNSYLVIVSVPLNLQCFTNYLANCLLELEAMIKITQKVTRDKVPNIL